VPARVIDGLGFGAYNFHPGPPRYPGWAPAHFALYERASEFGITVHVMVDKVDAGPIVSVIRFAIPPHIDAAGLEGLAYAHLAQMFWNLAAPLACDSRPLPVTDIKWNTKKIFAPRLSRDLRDSARHRQGGVRAAAARVRRQPFRHRAQHSPPWRGVHGGRLAAIVVRHDLRRP
jgi:methionyl-tRNA formyltransferase